MENITAWAMLEQTGWQVFTAMAAIPTLVASIAGYLMLPESPRWLVDMDRVEEAAVIVQKWAKDNKRDVKSLNLTKVATHTENVSVLDLCRRSALRWKTFAHGIVWFCFGVCYYGVVMLLPRIFQHHTDTTAVSGGPETCDLHFDNKDLLISSTCEIVGVAIAIAMIDKPGRVTTQGIFYGLTGVCCFLLGFRNIGVTFLTVVASLGRLGAMAASCATWVHCPELFPTTVRGEAHSLMNLMSKLGGFLAPYVISDLFTQIQCGIIMAVISFAGMFFACTLPETAGEELSAVSEVPETEYTESDLDSLSGFSED
ncbi:unnamed protein product [Effrenium voratum]|nr:unnamed protein product [Effrenium voratum]